jgi:hypothetical protein
MNRADVTELHYITAIAKMLLILVRSVREGEWGIPCDPLEQQS